MSVRILATRGTESQIQSASSASQSEGQIAYATDTKEFYVSDGTQFNKIGKDQLSQFSEISVVSNIDTWHLSDTNRLDLNPPESNPTGITFKPDGTKAFVLGYSLNRVQMYDLSTAWDLTTAGSPTQSEYLVQNNLGGTQEDFFIDSSGTRMYVLSRSSDSVGQFTLNTAWDISDITFVQDVHMNSTSLSGGVAGFVTGEDNPMGITFKPDGTIMYITGYTTDDVFQIPLSTAWDISTHGTITSVDVSIEGTPNAVQFNNDGTVMYIMGYSTDAILQYNLSTAWDVTTASFVKRTTPFIRILDGTGTGFYYNETEQKAFVCGRASDFAYEVIISEAIRFSDPVSAEVLQGDKVIANELITGYTGRNDFFNSTYTHSHFQTYSNAYLGYNSGAQNVRVGNTVYGNYRFHVFQGNYIDAGFISNPTGALPNIRFFNPYIGGVGVFSIGKTHNTSTTYLLGGVTDIESEADTFDHKGEITLGGELKVTGNQPLKYKDPNLYTQGTQIVLDNFTEASDTDLLNHTPDTGSGYTQVFITSGTSSNLDYAKISGGNGYVSPARNNSNDGFRFTNDTTISTANYEARAVIKRQSTSDDPFVLVVKYIDEDNYFAMHFAGNYNYCTPISVVNGVYTQHGALYYYANTSSADNINIEVALRVVGNNVHLFYEGRYRGSREVNITGAGKAGIGFGKSQNSILTSYDLSTSAQISKFEVYELPDSLFDGSDSVHYIENGGLGIGTTSIGTAKVVIDHTNTKMLELKRNGATKARFIADSNNGQLDLYDSSTVNSVRLLSSGNSYFNGGNVGIGTTSPYATLTVAGNITQTENSHLISTRKITARDAAGLSLYNDGGQGIDIKDNNDVIVTSGSGNVGIGTTSPTAKLDVVGKGVFESVDIFKVDATANPRLRVGRYDAETLNFDVDDLIARIYHKQDETDSSVHKLNLTVDSDSTGGSEINLGFRDNDGSNESTKLAILSSGNVGIGTTSPSWKLDLNGGTENVLASFSSTDQTAQLRIVDGSNIPFFFGVIGTGAYITPTGATPADGISIKDTGNVGIGIASPTSRLEVLTSTNEEGITLKDTSANLKYKVRQFNGNTYSSFWNASNSETVRIASAGNTYFNGGNIGIGTTSPQAKLDVEGVIYSRDKFVLIGSSGSSTRYAVIEQNGTEGVFRLYNGNNWGLIARGVGNGPYIGAYREGKLRIRGFGQSDGSDDATDKDLAIFDFANERVGIGTTSPNEKLQVNGNAIVQNYVYIGDGVQHWGDGGTGMNFPSNDNIDFLTSSSSRVRINSSGNVGIGTTSPSTKFHVDGNIRVGDANDVIYTNKLHGLSIGDLTLYTSGNTLLTQTGNVGIGNTNPTHTVEIGTDGGGEKILKMHSDTANSYFEIQSLGNVARLLATNNTNLLLQSDGTGGYITFNANSAERMRILYNGNVGIGTTSPDHLLHVSGNAKMSNIYLLGNIIHEGDVDTQIKFATDTITFDTAGSERLTINSTGNVDLTGNLTVTKSSATIKAIETGGGDVRMTAGGATGYIGTYNNNSLQLVQNGNVALFVDTSRNVGIGTTNPEATALLDVSSTTKGVLFPRMTSAQRTAISSPATGLIVYQTDSTEGLYIYKSTGWIQII